MPAIVTAHNLGLTIGGKSILEDVSFSIESGEYVGLIGPNGAGKTSLIKIMLGLYRPTAGTISVDSDLTIGYVAQSFGLSDVTPISVQEVLGMSGKQTRAKYQKALAKVELDASFLGRNFHELSGGQKQRVVIARALCLDPDMLVFDESLSGVDYETKKKMYALLSQLNTSDGMTILFVSHEVDKIVDSCDHILCLNKTMHTGCHPMDFAKGNIHDCPVLETGAHVMPVHHHHSSNDSGCC